MPDGVGIVGAGPERIDDLEPLWRALFDQHAATGAALGPMLAPAESWRRRRAFYDRELRRDGALLLLAEHGGRPVGYAMVAMIGPSHTWELEDPAAELESLAVLPEFRGRGIGRALLHEVKARLREAGFSQVRLEVLATNDDARRLYEKEGFRPRFVQMSAPL